MKYSIDEEVCRKKGLNILEVFLLIAASKCDIPTMLDKMVDKNLLIKDIVGSYIPLQTPLSTAQSVLLSSDTSIPSESTLEVLYDTLKEFFPKGRRAGQTVAWRSNRRDVVVKLQKFFKLYGDTYSHEDIVEATRKYVNSFNGDYTFMKSLNYFIHKEDRTKGESVSTLADWLESSEDDSSGGNLDWAAELR